MAFYACRAILHSGTWLFGHANHAATIKCQSLDFYPQTPIRNMDFDDILINGISFSGSSGPKQDGDKVKTKAKKKKYITGAHGSGSARQKAKYREQRANRKSQKKK